MKRLFSIICVIAMIFSYPVMADAADVEFIKDGIFDEDSEYWSESSGAIGTEIIYSNNNGADNSACVQLNGTGSKEIIITQEILGIVGDNDYTLSFWAKSAVANKELRVKFEFYATEYCGDYLKTFKIGTEGGEYSDTVEVPQNATRAYIQIRSWSNCSIWCDNVSFKGAGNILENPPSVDPDSLPLYFGDEPKEALESELFTNGNLNSTSSGGSLKNWVIDPYYNKNNFMSYTKDISRDGNGGSILVNNVGSIKESPYVYQEVSVEEFAEYQASFYIRSYVLSRTGVGIDIAYYNGSTYLHTEWGARTRVITGTNWVKHTQTFIPPKNATLARIMFRVYDSGIVYFDDMSCVKTHAPYKFKLETDDYFYYTDETHGKMTVTANLDKYPGLAAENVEITYPGGTSKQTLSNGSKSFSFPLADMSEQGTAYTVKAKLGDEEHSVTVYRYDRPKTLDAQGNYRRIRFNDDGVTYTQDENPINVVFAYHVEKTEYEKMAEAGINVIQGDANKATLDAAENAGLMVVATLYDNMYPAGNSINAEKTRERVEELKTHPALFGWLVMDEPFANNSGAESDLINSYKIIRGIDTVHPVWVLATVPHCEKAAKCTDILGIDPYPNNDKDPLSHVEQSTEKAINSIRAGKPVYTLLQAYDGGYGIPTTDELRNMLYQGLWKGSSSIGFYEIHSYSGYEPIYSYNNGELWNEIIKWNTNEKDIVLDYFIQKKGSLIDKSEQGNIWWQMWEAENNTYLLALNRTKSTVQKDIVSNLPIFNASLVGGADENSISITDSTIHITLSSSQAALYKITAPKQNTGEFYRSNEVLLTPSNGGVTTCFNILSEKKTNLLPMAALYEVKNNKLQLVRVYNLTEDSAEEGEAKLIKKDFTISEIQDGKAYILKAFLFEKGTIKPMCECATAPKS